MLKKWKVKVCGMFAAAVLLTGICPAQTYAFMEDADYVSIDSGVVDSITVNGVTVDALYQPYGSWINTDTTYSCAAFVKRFYHQVFGRNVYGLENIYSIPAVDQGEFYATSSPKTGDIVRDNVSVHWAIVKEINSDGRATVIQQNAWNNPHTQAMVHAKIRLNDNRYTFFRWSGNEGGQEDTSVSASYSIEYGDKNVTETNAVLYGKVNNPNGVTVNQVGCYLWNEKDELIKYHLEDCSRSETRFNMWYDINSEFGVTLEPGTTYKYQFFVVDNGVECPGEIQTFKTSGNSVSDSDRYMPSEADVQNGILLLKQLLGQSQENMIEEVGEPVEKSEFSYIYDIHTLFLKPGRMETSFDQWGGVYDVTWTYTYSSGCDENKINSEKFYTAIVEAAKQVYGTDLRGFCTNPDNMTSAYDNNIRIERNIVNGIPVITVQVGGEA